MAIRRHYVNNAPVTTLTAGISAGATTCVPTVVVGLPSAYPYTALIDGGTATAEVVLVTAAVGSTLTMTRAYGGTAAQSHAIGAVFAHVAIDADYDEANLHVTSTSGVHGVAGALVGTSDVQVLTNKTLTSPAINGAALSGTLSGTHTESGNVTFSAAGTGVAVTNNATVGGTFGVTGATTAAAVTASGAVTANGAGTGLAVANNATVGGTMGVTGAHTAASYTANANGAVTGVLTAKSFTNEAARDAAITVPVNGTWVYLSAPTGAGTAAGFFQYTAGAWTPVKRPRIGGRATTNATQTINATTNTTLNNNGVAAWTATEDSGGFVSATGGTTTPLSVPAGLGGLYAVGVEYLQAGASGTRGFARILVNAAGTHDVVTTGHTGGSGSILLPLNAADTVGALGFSTIASTIAVACQVYCYRVSD